MSEHEQIDYLIEKGWTRTDVLYFGHGTAGYKRTYWTRDGHQYPQFLAVWIAQKNVNRCWL